MLRLCMLLPVWACIVHRAFAHPWPSFAPDFATEIVQTEEQNLGYFYTDQEGDVCCPTGLLNETYECKLQTQYVRGQYWEQGSKNRSRSNDVIEWYEDVMKAFVVREAGSGSKYKWECVAYCPLDELDPFVSLVSIGECGPEPESCPGKFAPKNKGEVMISQARPFNNVTRLVDDWAWTKLLAILPVELNSMYIDRADPNVPKPFLYVSKLAPAGQVQGVANLSYVGWKPVNFKTNDAFDVDPISIDSCPINPNGCGGFKKSRHKRLKRSLRRRTGQKHIDNEITKKRRDKMRNTGDVTAPNISFPADWSGFIEFEMVENSGGVTKDSGDMCCPYDSPSCELAYNQMSEYHYYDYTNQRLRIEQVGVDDDVQVVDFRGLKSMKVFNVSGEETCVEYCPLDPRAKLERFFYFPKEDPIHDEGETSWHGKRAHEYKWYDTILDHSIVITSYTLFVDETSKAKGGARPLEQYTDLTPFNSSKLERQRKTWKSFTPGVRASKFDIKGESNCPRAKNCNNDEHAWARRRYY